MQEHNTNQQTATETTGQQNAAENTKPNTHPEDNGVPGKTFTQEEVNKIVSDRLNRERMKAELSDQDTREIELSKRENRLACRDFLEENKYKPELLEIFDTSDIEKFKTAVQKLAEIAPQIDSRAVIPVRIHGGSPSSRFDDDSIARAFKLQ